MDFNYFYHRRQVSVMRADRAACDAARSSHQWLADAYGRLIDYEKSRRTQLQERGAASGHIRTAAR